MMEQTPVIQTRILEEQLDTWEPLSRPDYALLIVASLHQVLVVLAVSHLLWCRRWPPYVVKNVPLVCATGVAGVINLLGVVMSFGFVEYEEPSLLANCFFQGVVTWTGAGLYYCAAVVRVYRNYEVLIHHSVDMFRPTTQILLLQAPIWASTFALLFPSVAYMDFELNRCQGNARFVLLAAFNYGGLLLLGAAYLLWQMRNVRKQMNEYRVMLLSVAFLLASVILIDISSGGVATDSTLARRVALINNMLRSALLFWPVVCTPLIKYAVRDSAYAEQFTVGLASTLTPAMLRASLADQLKVEELWVHFRKIADEKMPPALPDFYKAVMERDKEEGHFERQAKTMDVIDTFIGDMAPSRVEISGACRERILASEVTRYNIFCEASTEVLKVMQETCEEAFQASAAYGLLLVKAEKEEAELEALKKAKLVPKVRNGPAGSGAHGARSDRWTISTVTGRRTMPIDEAGRVWLCCPLRRVKRSTVASRPPQKQGRQNSGTSTATVGASVACVPAPQRGILGTRSDVASQHTLGLHSPADTVGWGPGSPLPWLAEEDIEMGDASSEEEGNTRTPSNLSVSNTLQFASTTTSRPTPELPPPSDASLSDAPPSPMSCPSPATPRTQLPAPPPQRRPPPAPWAPWRRQPEHSIVPSSSSPGVVRSSDVTGVDSDGQAVAAEEGRVGAATRARGVVNSSSTESLVLLMPPSPATPPFMGNSSSAGSSARCGDRRWSGQQILSAGSRLSSAERGIVREDQAFGSCAAFAAVTGFKASRGFVPSMRLLEIAIAKEQDERRKVETLRREATRLPTTGLFAVPTDAEEEEEEKEEKDLEEAVEVVAGPVAAPMATREAVASSPVDSPPACVERMESISVVSPRDSPPACVERMESVGGSDESGGGLRQAVTFVGDEFNRSPVCSPSPSPSAMVISPPSSPQAQLQPAALDLELARGVEVEREGGDGDGEAASQQPLPPPLPLSLSSSSRGSISPSSHGQSTPLGEKLLRSPELLDGPPLSPSGSSTLSLQATPVPLPQAAPRPPLEEELPIALPRPSSVSPAAERLMPLPVRSVSPVDTAGDATAEGGKEEEPTGALGALSPELSTSPPHPTPSHETAAVPSDIAAPNTPPPAEQHEAEFAREEPAPSTPPMELLSGTRAPPRREARERAPRNRIVAAAEAQAQGTWPSQAAPACVKGSGPARAQPARAPAWSEPPPASLLRPPSHDTPAALPARVYCPTSYLEEPPPGLPSSPLRSSPPRPPPPPPLLALNLVAVGVPSQLLFTPPSPSGQSTSASPSSVRSSPVLVRPPMGSLPPAVPSGRDIAASGPGIPMAWSWSDSTLSGCSRSGGCGGWASSVSASVSSDMASPLVGMRFVGEDSSGSVREPPGSRSSLVPGVMGVPELPLMGVRGSPPLPVGRLAGGEPAVSAAAGVVSGAVPPSGVAVPPADSGLEGGVGGRQGKRPRRYFFP